MDYICTGFGNNSPSHNFRSLLSAALLVICLSYTWAGSGTGPDTGVTGPCRKKETCKPGAHFAHPKDCSSFFVCKPEGKGYDVASCPPGEQFDTASRQCKVGSVTCAGPCHRNNKKKKKQPNQSDPKLKLNNLNLNSTDSVAKSKDVSNKAEHLNTLGDNIEGSSAEAERVLKDKSDIHGPHLLSGTNTSHNLTDNSSSVITQDKNKNVVTDATAHSSTEPTLHVTSQHVPLPVTSSNKMPEKSIAPEVGVPGDATPDPPYDVLTDEYPASAASNGSNDADDDSESKTDPAIIAGASIAVILLVILIIILLVFLFKRRRFKKGRDIEKIENPQYQKEPVDTQYRFSRDSTLYVGNTVDLKKKNKNNSPKKDSSPDKKKRSPPPRPPAPSPSPKSKLKKDKSKRKAPPPPNPFGELDDLEETSSRDLYEKDSNASSDNIEMSTFTARNESADIPSIDGEETSPSDPLLQNNLTPPQKPPRLSLSPRNAKIVQQKLSEISSSSSSEESDEEKQTLTNPDTATSDGYDKKKNPFEED